MKTETRNLKIRTTSNIKPQHWRLKIEQLHKLKLTFVRRWQCLKKYTSPQRRRDAEVPQRFLNVEKFSAALGALASLCEVHFTPFQIILPLTSILHLKMKEN